MNLTDPWKTDPGPCPVDDCAHHTCTSPGYVGKTIVVPPWRAVTRVTIPEGAVPDLVSPARQPTPGNDPDVVRTVTTDTYRRQPPPRTKEKPR
jgi:hypothetical protein